ncbi:MAG: ABC transporter ATP-binding protein [Lachnospiraceae bacterium]|nr:ABC transporter ATP-binding protein [Candidatus Merdinaster equi]
MNNEDIILSVEKLNSFYKKTVPGKFRRERIQVLKDVTFDMKKGEILGLVGESGCGKSTLAKTILNMVPDYSGTIICNDKNPQMVFQDPHGSLNPSKTIEFLLSEPMRNLTDIPQSEWRDRAAEMLVRVGLDEDYLGRLPRELSGGQRQRVCIAASLMLKPGLLIADEPVSALDVTIQAQVCELLLKLKEELGLSILFISHDLRVVYQLCDRVIIMKNGEIKESGTTDEVYFNPQNEYTKKLLNAAFGVD